MSSYFEQGRVAQLISLYAPGSPPALALDFGDLLSLIWRIDQSASLPARERYYRRCALALCRGLMLEAHPIYRFVELTPSGDLCRLLPTLVYRISGRVVDAHDRRASVDHLLRLRLDILRIGTAHETWLTGWPGSGIQESELRERVFAVLFTALPGQFAGFARLLLVIDIVIANLLIGLDAPDEVLLSRLIAQWDYPDPALESTHEAFSAPA